MTDSHREPFNPPSSYFEYSKDKSYNSRLFHENNPNPNHLGLTPFGNALLGYDKTSGMSTTGGRNRFRGLNNSLTNKSIDLKVLPDIKHKD